MRDFTSPVCLVCLARSAAVWLRRIAATRPVAPGVAARRLCVMAVMCVALLTGTAHTGTAHAMSLVVSWDANTEADLAGYIVYYRSENGTSVGQVKIGTQTTVTLASLLDNSRYFISVAAYNTQGVIGLRSDELDTAPPPDPDIELPIPTPEGTRDAYFAEGATGIFKYQLALVNVSPAPADIRVKFLREAGTPVEREYRVEGYSRGTVTANGIPQLQGTSFAAVVSGPASVITERTMSWDMGRMQTGAHTAKSVAKPSTEWFLAEGNAGYFETYILLANPNASAADVQVDFLLDDGKVLKRNYQVGANRRLTILANDIPELLRRSFGTTVRASQPIMVERSMYFRNGSAVWQAGHASAAISEGSKRWFLAEGHTGGMFDVFVLLSNPNPRPVTATIRYLTPRGVARTETRTLKPTSRETIWVDVLPGLSATDVSCDISADAPIIVERSMYWPAGAWFGAHNSAGMPSLSTAWALAEGVVGGPDQAESYILMANPGGTATQATLTFLREGGKPPIVRRQMVPAGARVTVAASRVGMASGERFGVAIVTDQPIAVERSIYTNADGMMWASGTNETGTPLQ